MTIPREIRWFNDLSVTHHTVDILLRIYKFESINSAQSQ